LGNFRDDISGYIACQARLQWAIGRGKSHARRNGAVCTTPVSILLLRRVLRQEPPCSAWNQPGAQALVASPGDAGGQDMRKNFILHHVVESFAIAKVLLFKL
jgi:hypothetical protein